MWVNGSQRFIIPFDYVGFGLILWIVGIILDHNMFGLMGSMLICWFSAWPIPFFQRDVYIQCSREFTYNGTTRLKDCPIDYCWTWGIRWCSFFSLGSIFQCSPSVRSLLPNWTNSDPRAPRFWTGWWFGTCFIFHYIWDVILPIDELIYFKIVF